MLTKRRQRRASGEGRGDGGVEMLCTGVPELIVALDVAPELYTVLYTIVGCGGAFFFRGFRASTWAIMSLTAFGVKSLSLSEVTFVSGPPALMRTTGSRQISFEHCVWAHNVREEHIWHN